MPALPLQHWNDIRLPRLDEIERAHTSVGGTSPGRRYATQQINHAYAVLLSSQFQGFCRDLHTESVDFLVRAVTPPSLRPILRAEFIQRRRLDTGNPNPGNVGADFGRLGLEFWPKVQADDPRNRQRQILLGEMNEWRNAIAHQDFDTAILGGSTVLHLKKIRSWRRASMGLAESFDAVLRAHLLLVVGTLPW